LALILLLEPSQKPLPFALQMIDFTTDGSPPCVAVKLLFNGTPFTCYYSLSSIPPCRPSNYNLSLFLPVSNHRSHSNIKQGINLVTLDEKPLPGFPYSFLAYALLNRLSKLKECLNRAYLTRHNLTIHPIQKISLLECLGVFTLGSGQESWARIQILVWRKWQMMSQTRMGLPLSISIFRASKTLINPVRAEEWGCLPWLNHSWLRSHLLY